MDRILDFYWGAPWYLKKKWEAAKARTACLDYAIKAFLRLAGGSEGRKRTAHDRPVVMCLGLGSFDSQSGLPSKHSVLERKLVIKVWTHSDIFCYFVFVVLILHFFFCMKIGTRTWIHDCWGERVLDECQVPKTAMQQLPA